MAQCSPWRWLQSPAWKSHLKVKVVFWKWKLTIDDSPKVKVIQSFRFQSRSCQSSVRHFPDVSSASLCPSAAPVTLEAPGSLRLSKIGHQYRQFHANSFEVLRYNPDLCQVELQVGNVEENIDISTEWEKGQAGYIGTGFTKRGIYVFLQALTRIWHLSVWRILLRLDLEG